MKIEKLDTKTKVSAAVALISALGTADIITDHIREIVNFNAGPVRGLAQFIGFVSIGGGVVSASMILGYLFADSMYDTAMDVGELVKKIKDSNIYEEVVENTTPNMKKGA